MRYLILLLLSAELQAGAVYSTRLTRYFTQYINDSASENEHDFHCPGDSFLVGMRTDYNDSLKRRRFAFVCAFMENASGEIMRKEECFDGNTNKEEPAYDHKPKAAGNSRCHSAETAMSGFLFQRKEGDYAFRGTCCKMKDWSGAGQKLAENSCKTLKFNAGGGYSELICPAGSVVTKYRSNYGPESQDRAIEITCCPFCEGKPSAKFSPHTPLPC